MRLLLLFILLSTSVSAQIANQVSTLTGANNFEITHCKYANNQVFHAGKTFGPLDQFYIVCTNTNGQVLWENVYPQSGRDETLYGFDVTSSSLYCVGSSRDSSATIEDGVIMRLDHSGNVLWKIMTPATICKSVYCLADGTIVIAGSHTTTRLDSSGNILWTRKDVLPNYPSLSYNSVIANDSGIYSIGMGNTFPGPYVVVVTKSHFDGQTAWVKKYYYSNSASVCTAVAAHDTDLYIAGNTVWLDPNVINYYPMFLMKLDVDGIPRITTSRNISTVEDSYVYGMTYTPYNTLAATVNLNGGLLAEFDIFTLQANRVITTGATRATQIDMDSSGNAWYNGSVSSVYPVCCNMDYGWNQGCGSVSSLLALQNLNMNYGDLSYTNDTGITTIPFNTNGIAVSHSWNSCTNPVGISEREDVQFFAYPNPSMGELTIELSEPCDVDKSIFIYNIMGELVVTETISAGILQIKINLQSLCNGNYFVRIDGEDAKMIEVINE